MKIGRVYAKEIVSLKKMKPSFFLNEGKRNLIELERQNRIKGTLNEYLEDVFRPGIFKRIFVQNESTGYQYFTASDMMKCNPLDYAKYLSKKITTNAQYMAVKNGCILVSCAGTVGNVKLIDSTLDNVIASQDIIRVIPKSDKIGFVYAYLSSKSIYEYIQSLIYGSVVSRIEPDSIRKIPLVKISDNIISSTNNLIEEATNLRKQALENLHDAEELLMNAAHLDHLSSEDYDYYGPRSQQRKVSCFIRKKTEIDTTTINAFNLSERIRKTKGKILCSTKKLKDILKNGETFSTGSFPRVEVKEGNGIMLINQSDIFDNIIKGKYISKRNIKLSNLVEYGEVLIAGVGTLGENETFCRVIFASEDLEGQLVSGEFIRMNTNNKVPSGYLFTWLSSDYGFRFLRNIQAGTKLCRPIPKLIKEIPIPILEGNVMDQIDSLVRQAFTKRHYANIKERNAIDLIEQQLENW